MEGASLRDSAGNQVDEASDGKGEHAGEHDACALLLHGEGCQVKGQVADPYCRYDAS